MSWRVVVPFKGAPGSKSRLAARFDDATRHALALAFLRDAVVAVRGTSAVAGVVIVSSEPGLTALFGPEPGLAPVELTPDPGTGLNPAIAHGVRVGRAAAPDDHVAALLGDLPELTSDELAAALDAAAKHPLASVADASGAGTTMITLAPAVDATPHFGGASAAAHAAAGFALLDLPVSSGLRRDVDAPDDVDRIASAGANTRAVLEALHKTVARPGA